jgi:uncharacterized protein (DUF362 family)
MKRMKIKKRQYGYLLLIAALIAISWDIARSTQSIEKGTFRYESEFDAISGATTQVGIVTSDFEELSNPVDRNTNPSYKQIEEMVGKAIELQGGFEWIIDKGDKVLIKVNLVGANSASGNGENTDVRVVKALIKHIADYTKGDVEITIAEGSARANDDPTDPESIWGNSGYTDLLTDPDLSGIKIKLLNLNQTLDDLVEIDLGSKGTSAAQGSIYHVHKAEVEADVYIAVPVLKIHDTGITNALKLQIGTAPGCYYGYNKTAGTTICPNGLIHVVGQRVWTTEAIVDLSTIADIDFVVVDAIMCLESQKTDKVSNRTRLNTILAGADPVAIDHVAAKIMGLNPDDVAHITLAEKVGLGTNDKDKITIKGVPLEKAMKKVKKSQAADGKFGQSNRTWILSQPFEGTDINKEYFVDEAKIQPLPGDNGWSQPVYFFDDRIDLYSYYSGLTNVITYAFTYFNVSKDQKAELWLGTQEAILVYLNGEEVYKFTITTPYGDNDRGTNKKIINLKAGRNTLLVKTLNKFGDFTFALNICEPESDPNYSGNRVSDLKFYIDESGSKTQNITTGVYSFKNDNSLALKCYPNPVNTYTTIHFNLKETNSTKASIYDINGKLVKVLCNEKLIPGNHQVTWNLNDNKNFKVIKGTYLCIVESGKMKTSLKISVE